jgi:ABC-type sugar transport system ATPase subunit
LQTLSKYFDGVFLLYLKVPEEIITLRNISKHYAASNNFGVTDISISIATGDFVAIVGESGSGKSTLLKLIYGLLTPDTGEVLFKGKHVDGPLERLIPGHDQMKMVTQDFNLNTYAKVYDNMEFLRIGKLANKRVVELSGGEQQRVAIARAIITEPEVLLMDEPFSQLDAVLKSLLRADLRNLSKNLGITIIIVSHDPVDGLSLADELIVLKNGFLIEKGEPYQLYNFPKDIYTAKLLADCNVLDKESAKLIGIYSDSQAIAIYIEDVIVENSPINTDYILLNTFFKGFSEELLIEKNGVTIRALNLQIGKYKIGQILSITIKKYLEFK